MVKDSGTSYDIITLTLHQLTTKSGYNTNHGLEVLPQWFPTPEQASVRILLIFFGANDCNRGPSTKQYVPLEQFRTNLVNIITYPLVKAHNPRIILVTPAPVDEATCRETNAEWGNSDDPRRVKDTLAYRDMVLQVGSELGHPVVDLWSAMMKVCG
ncbi:GDSL Lipase Acylhydrolase family protein [Rutstroemia sp. NJR-2017a BVV2]|nr:GDSL Lipase Acylhydrolase family protein [Rutstroemia sp. NJR-2017a BVV2]